MAAAVLNNYDITNVPGSWEITKVNATISVSDYTGNFDGQAHGATGTATGVKGEALAGLNLGASFTNVPGGTANWTFTDATGNYNNANGSVQIVINKAPVTATAGSYSGVYDGDAHSPDACKVTGSYTGGLTCVNNPTSVGPNVGKGTVTPVMAAAVLNNYDVKLMNGAYSITQASSTVMVTCGVGPFTYNGSAQTPCSATVTGAGGLSQTLTVNYTNNTNAGTATASASYAGDTNHTANSDSKQFTINKANATITVTGYNVIWDGNAHTATGTAKGVLNETLSGLDLSGTTHTAVKTYNDTWTFTDITGNYNNTSGTVVDTIGAWTIDGYYQPVEWSTTTLVWNVIKGGSTVPLKFNIFAGTVKQTSTAAVQGASAELGVVGCGIPGLVNNVDTSDIDNTGATVLRYDGGQFIQNWKTAKAANVCYVVRVTAADGSTRDAYFKMK
jgi:hypothetical protein